MPKYKVQWTLEKWYTADIEASSPAEAEEKFWAGEYTNEKHYGGELQGDIDIKEEEKLSWQ